MSIKES